MTRGDVTATNNMTSLLMFNLVVKVAGEPIPKWSGVCVSCSPQLASGKIYRATNVKGTHLHLDPSFILV